MRGFIATDLGETESDEDPHITISGHQENDGPIYQNITLIYFDTKEKADRFRYSPEGVGFDDPLWQWPRLLRPHGSGRRPPPSRPHDSINLTWTYCPCHPERSEGSPFARSKTLPVAICFIPPDIVLRSVRQDSHSDFVTFLLSILDPVVVEDLVRDYQLDALRFQRRRPTVIETLERVGC